MPEVREDVCRAVALMQASLTEADSGQVDLLCFPECYLQGYLTDYSSAGKHALQVDSPAFEDVLARFASFHCMFIFGFIEIENGRLFNSAAVVHGGRLVGRYRKVHLLPGEGIFDAGTDYPIFEVRGLPFGINICYDTNFSDAAAAVAGRGAKLIVCPANNMMRTEVAEQTKMLHNQCRAQRARETGCWFLSSDVTGTRGNRISYGPTAVIAPDGTIVAQVPLLQPGMVSADVRGPGNK